MLFSSYQFILIFLPVALTGYFLLRISAPKSLTLFWLILVSLAFYAYWEVWNLLVLFTSIIVNFACGSALAERARTGKSTKPLLAAGVAFNVGLIGCFKYAGFFATNVNAVFGTQVPVLELALPLAISFFTFQE